MRERRTVASTGWQCHDRAPDPTQTFFLMKTRSLLAIALGAILFALSLSSRNAEGATVVVDFNGINQLIPDGSAVGLSDSRTISTGLVVIDSVLVFLNITGGFNGDFYAQLTHGSGFSVLLNRVGRTASNPFGYGDPGLDVTFSDSALAVADVHQYRATLFGNETTALGGQLTGAWNPDGRAVDPSLVVNTDARTALLSSFNGLNPNGEWTLFIADLDGGGQATLQSWGLSIDGQPLGVPEPEVGGFLLLSLLVWSGFGRSRKGGSSVAQSGGLSTARITDHENAGAAS